MRTAIVIIWFSSLVQISSAQQQNNSTDKSWFNNGPFAAHVNCLDVSKTDPNTIYLGTYGDGVYVSANKGLSWVQCSTKDWQVFTDSVEVSPTQPNWWFGNYPPITFISIDPSDSKHVYIGLYNQGIRESNDGGKTWTIIGAEIPTQTDYSKLLINEENPSEMFVLGGRFLLNGGLYKSNNGGKTWQVVVGVPHGSEVSIEDIVRDPADKNHLLVGVGRNNTSEFLSALMESHDNGETWKVLNNKGAFNNICFDPENSNHLLSIIYTGWQTWELGRSTDGGVNWKYEYSNEVLLGGSSLYKDTQGNLYLTRGYEPQYLLFSANFGATWEPLDTLDCYYTLNASKQIRATESNIYFGNLFGFYYAQTPQSTFEPRNEGISNSYIQRLAVDPRDNQVVYAAGEQGLWKSTDGANNWKRMADWTVHAIAIDTLHPDTLYYGGYGLCRSFDGGKTTEDIYHERFGRVEDIVINPKNTNIIFCRTSNSIQKSVDCGKTWVALVSGSAGTLAIDPNHPDTLYCGEYRSTDGGVEWYDVEKKVIRVQPGNSNKLYALFRGEFAFSENWGLNWKIPDNYKDFPYAATYSNNFYMNKSDDQNLYYTTAHGIRYSNNGGSTWNWLKGDFNSRVLDVVALPDEGIYYVATHGYGVWAYNTYTSINDNEIKNTKPEDQLFAYPNPFINTITLTNLPKTKGELKIINCLGQTIYNTTISGNANIAFWDGKDNSGKLCTSGTYIIIYISDVGKIRNTKIIKL